MDLEGLNFMVLPEEVAALSDRSRSPVATKPAAESMAEHTPESLGRLPAVRHKILDPLNVAELTHVNPCGGTSDLVGIGQQLSAPRTNTLRMDLFCSI